MITADKQLSHSSEAEAGILSSILVDSRLFDSVARLDPDVFFLRSNKLIWQSIIRLIEKGVPVDPITVTEDLKSEEKLEEVGGHYYISKLTTAYSSIHEIEHLAEILEEKKKLRDLIELSSQMALDAYNNKPSCEVIENAESKLFSIAVKKVEDNGMIRAASELQRKIDQIRAGELVTGLKTGIEPYDRPHGGLHPSHVYGIGARPGCGKTTVGVQSCVNMAMRDIPCLMISLEMDEERLLGRGAAYLAGITFTDFKNQTISARDLDSFERAKNTLSNKPWRIICPVESTGMGIRAIIRQNKRSHDIKFAVVDYIQLVEVLRGEDERVAIARASNQLRLAAKECKIPVMILSQLNRESEKESRPKLHHLKNSGQIEQDCDSVTLIWNEKDQSQLSPGEALPVIFSIEKNRDGMQGDQRLAFDGAKQKFLPRK